MLYTSDTFVSYNYPPEEADIIFLGIPFASTSISKPSIFGPVMVRESLKLVEDFLEGRNLFQSLKICDLGNIEIVPGSYEKTAERIRATINDVREKNSKAFLIFIGGEHSITLPIAEALKPVTIIQLDAHADLRKDYLENEYTHQTWAYHASKLAKIVQIGVQTMSRDEKEYIKNNKNIQTFDIASFLEQDIKLQKPVHLTVDIDVFDPSYVETGLPEGRLKPDAVLELIKKIDCDSMDIVEIADDRLPSKTGFLAAGIIKNILAKK